MLLSASSIRWATRLTGAYVAWLTSRHGRPFAVLSALALLLAIVVVLEGAALPAPPASHNGLYSLAAAKTAEAADKVMQAWRDAEPSLIPAASRALWLDFAFVLVYFPLIAFGCFYLAAKVRERISGKWGAASWILGLAAGLSQLPAALLDIGENSLLLIQLHGETQSSAAWLAFWCAQGKFALASLGIGVALIFLLILLSIKQRTFPVIQFLWHSRFPVIIGVFLIGLGPLSVLALPLLLRNLFSLSGADFAVVASLTAVAAWTTLLTLRNVLLYGAQRFDLDSTPSKLPDWMFRHRYILTLGLSAPILATTLIVSRAGWFEPVAWMSVGIVGAFLLVVVAGIAQHLLGDPTRGPFEMVLPEADALFRRMLGPPRSQAIQERAEHGRFRRVIQYLRPYLRGYFTAGNRILPGHVQAMAFLGMTFAVYIALRYPLRPDVDGRGLHLPTLAYVLILIIASAWIFAGVGFFLDRYRIPTLLSLALFTLLSVFGADHFYKIYPAQGPARPIAPEGAFDRAEEWRAEFQQHGDERVKPIVVVAASGGGITAALWTARVLTGLQQRLELGDEFARSIRFISSASGGTVGAMHYLDSFTRQGFRYSGKEIRDNASASSLDSLAWGLVYSDLWRGLLPGVFRLGILDDTVDRGWALERAWTSRLHCPNLMLSNWVQAVNEGWLPAAAFNATVVESGEQYVFTPLKVPESWGANSLHDDDPNADIAITTAARLSSTFPWISPIARPRFIGPAAECNEERAECRTPRNWHLADGGYYDNFGVISAINWIETIVEQRKSKLEQTGILLVRISASGVPEKLEGASDQKDRGWTYATAGPVLTLVEVLFSTQLHRNNLEVKLLKEKWALEDVTIASFSFDLRVDAPLSWKLTAQEKESIEKAWKKEHNKSVLDELVDCFKNIVGCAATQSRKLPPLQLSLAPRPARSGG